MSKKEKRYVINGKSFLPDFLNEKKLYLNVTTKELQELDAYKHFVLVNQQGQKLVEVKNKKAAMLLFNDNRQKLPRGI
jgi:hypothetical protein